METIEYTHLVRDTLTLHLNTQEDCSIPLNGTMKSKVYYDLKNYIDFDNDDSIEYVTVCMPYAVLCNSNYIFYSGNDTVNITYGGSTYSFTVSHGNYNASTFGTFLMGIFPAGMTYNFSTTTNKYTFSYTGGGLWGFDLGTTCDYNIGFKGSLLTTDGSITCPYSCDFLPISRYIIHCDVLSHGLMLTTGSAVSSCDIIASVPNNARLNSQIVYNSTGVEYLVRSLGNNGITITITNDNNQEIDFNNVSSYFTLQFNIYRKQLKRPQRFSNLVNAINSKKVFIPDNVIIEEE